MRAPLHTSLVALVALVALCQAALGCGDGGATLEGGTLRTRDTRYRVGELGNDWYRIEIGAHNDVAFAHRELDAVIQASSSCDPALDIPLAALTNHLLIGFTERDVREQVVVPFDSREAMRTHVVAKLDGVPREMLLLVVKKDGCVYDFALAAPPGERFARARSAWESFLAPFHAEREQP